LKRLRRLGPIRIGDTHDRRLNRYCERRANAAAACVRLATIRLARKRLTKSSLCS